MDTPPGVVETLRVDYQLKAAYLTDQFSRLWLRFNFLLTIQVGLFGALGYFLFGQAEPHLDAATWPMLLGLLTAILWFFVGVQDRYLVEEYRTGLRTAFLLLRQHATLEQHWSPTDYVGYHHGLDTTFVRRGWLSWYFRPASVTLLAAWLPLLAMALWVIALVMRMIGRGLFGHAGLSGP